MLDQAGHDSATLKLGVAVSTVNVPVWIELEKSSDLVLFDGHEFDGHEGPLRLTPLSSVLIIGKPSRDEFNIVIVESIVLACQWCGEWDFRPVFLMSRLFQTIPGMPRQWRSH